MQIDEKIMSKIRKCLALSESNNVHEAAAALRQAKALMDKHKLSMSDVELSRVDVVEVGTDRARPPNWKIGLYLAVSKAFGCSLFMRGGRPVFVGTTPSPDIAKYALDVLLRQLESNKKEYLCKMKSGRPDMKRTAKVRLGKGYAEGWVIGCRKIVEQFAATLSDDDTKAHLNRVSAYYEQDKIPEGKAKKSALDDSLGMIAGQSGFEDGQKAQIHPGMNTAGNVDMISYQE